MFRCGLCQKQSNPREKAIRVVLVKDRIVHPEKGNPGTRIVKEVLAHEACLSDREMETKPPVITLDSLAHVPDGLLDKVSDAFTLARKREL